VKEALGLRFRQVEQNTFWQNLVTLSPWRIKQHVNTTPCAVYSHCRVLSINSPRIHHTAWCGLSPGQE
jgi:hypothetical protein